MFDIASEEASRLLRLTTEFLAYARPRPPTKWPGFLSPSLPPSRKVADLACQLHATLHALMVAIWSWKRTTRSESVSR